LETYRGLLAGGHDDPRVRAELDQLITRVETLLADQDLRWEADGAFLMMNPDVRAELNLTPDQIRRVEQAWGNLPLPGKGREPGRGPEPGKGPPDPGRPRPPDGGLETRIDLIKMLTPAQRLRLRQLSVQFRGPRAFDFSEVVAALNL